MLDECCCVIRGGIIYYDNSIVAVILVENWLKIVLISEIFSIVEAGDDDAEG